MRPFRLASLAALLALALVPRAAHAAAVDMALVLAVDVSESVSAEEYVLQHEGIARAFENPQVVAAIKAGAQQAIDVLVLEWSDRDKQAVVVDWTRVADAASAAAFATKIRAGQRSSSGLTGIGDALLAAAAALDRLEDKAKRWVIDVSGDGMANVGPPPAPIRDALVARGITINGLAILASEPWLDTYYNNDLIGGEGAFLLQVQDFQSFATAIEQKLLAEIAARSPGKSRKTAQIQ
jgi:Mg-chelatase subunit ChlD